MVLSAELSFGGNSIFCTELGFVCVIVYCCFQFFRLLFLLQTHLPLSPCPLLLLKFEQDGADAFAVETNQPVLNPAGCSCPDGYLATSSDAGYKTNYSAVLLEFALAKQVTIIVSDTECSSSRPKILGVYVSQ